MAEDLRERIADRLFAAMGGLSQPRDVAESTSDEAERLADAVLAVLADADPTDLGFKWLDGITYCTFHDATMTAERAQTGACDRAHHFCAEVPVYARLRPEETTDD